MEPNMRPTHSMCQAHVPGAMDGPGFVMHHMHMDKNKALGLAVRARRQALGLKQPQLAERLTSLDQASISRIENGKQGLTLDSLEELASALGTRPGVLQLEADAIADQADGNADGATAFQLTQAFGVRHVPLISWVEAGSFSEAVDSYARGTGVQMVQTSVKVGRLAYALRVHGQSMNNPRDDHRSFPEGSIIIVDPHREYSNSSLIIARLENEKEVTFKQFVEEGSDRFLLPLNPQFQAIPIDRPMMFCGLVVARAEQEIQ